MGAAVAMGDHPAMQVRNRAAPVGSEQEWKHGVNQAREAGFHQRKAERRGDAEVFDIGFADRRRMVAKVFQ